MPQLSRRSMGFEESIIRKMTIVANAHNAVNLSQGFPDFSPPRELLSALAETVENGPHQYATTWGAQNFREALAKKQSRLMGMSIDPEREIIVTCGGTEAMMVAMMTVCNPGDKVIVFSPFYENYAADAILSGAEPIYVPLVPPAFEFDPDVLEAACKQRPKALVLCNPSNPTGKVFTRQELEIIAQMAEKYDFFVITDEVYEHLVYEPNQHIYFASLPHMRERTISCSSLSKTYSITGWRLGYIITTPEITEAARKVHDFLTVGTSAPLQQAAVAGLQLPDSYYREFLKMYQGKRDLFCNGLHDLGFSYVKPDGAYYVMMDIREFAQGRSDTAFCYWLTEKIGVAAVPGSSFFKEPVHNLIRFHFAKKDQTLYEALNRLSGLKRFK